MKKAFLPSSEPLMSSAALAEGKNAAVLLNWVSGLMLTVIFFEKYRV